MTSPPIVTLRRARDDDAERFLEWRNDTEAVRFSVSGRPVTGEEHAAVVHAARDGAGQHRVHLWVAEEGREPRWDRSVSIGGDGVGVVSIAVAPEHRGRGIGSEMLRAMAAKLPMRSDGAHVPSLLHPDNVPSLRAFEAGGLSPDGGNRRAIHRTRKGHRQGTRE